MRGRINYYNEKTGTGVISTQFKRIFEFKEKAWHDFHNTPMRGMYVYFRTNEQHQVVDCKESRFKELQKDYNLKEEDFWNSDDEEELQELAEQKRDEIINQGITAISPQNPLKESVSIDSSFDRFFAEPIAIIYKYRETLLSDINDKKLDYFVLKRFLSKAKSQLTNMDTGISIDRFSEMEQELTRLEHQLAVVIRQMKKELPESFEEIYLHHQIPYLRTLRRIQLDDERKFQIGKMQKKLGFDLQMNERKAKIERNEKLRTPVLERIAKIKEQTFLLAKELKQIEQNRELFVKNIKNFRNKKFNEFVAVYKFEDEQKRIHDYIRSIMDHITFNYDNLIWNLSIDSGSIKNNFYRQQSEGPFCIMTFVRYYLKQLNKGNLSPADQALFRYIKSYDRQKSKKFLLLSENKELLERLRVTLFGLHKNVLVYPFPRAVESLHWIKANLADFIVIDNNIKTLTPLEFLDKNLRSQPKSKQHTRFIILHTREDDRLKSLGIETHYLPAQPLDKSEFENLVSSLMGLNGKSSRETGA